MLDREFKPGQRLFDIRFEPIDQRAVNTLATSLGMYPPDMLEWDHETHRHFGKQGALFLEEGGCEEAWWLTAFTHDHEGGDDAEGESIRLQALGLMSALAREWQEITHMNSVG